jgi:hypothetical protein
LADQNPGGVGGWGGGGRVMYDRKLYYYTIMIKH